MSSDNTREVHLSDSAVGSDALTVVKVEVTATGEVGTATDTLGLETKTYKINVSELDEAEGTYHYELVDSEGTVLVSGVGNELSDALLGFAVHLEGEGGD